jgi:hypothetical protein
MANKTLFSSTRGALLPATNTVNGHGVGAYDYSPRHKLAQYAMRSSITGHRRAATSAVRCVDVAALITAAVVRKNNAAIVLPFQQVVRDMELNPRDSVVTNAQRLASIGGAFRLMERARL